MELDQQGSILLPRIETENSGETTCQITSAEVQSKLSKLQGLHHSLSEIIQNADTARRIVFVGMPRWWGMFARCWREKRLSSHLRALSWCQIVLAHTRAERV
ncbi:hypothetical protein EYF80_013044 [Liparis tanakae]|uniref:Uncharacterized protein n=1 Tax=Liparis tanakae TaxID=230148 RepID=A0A4Z2IGJ8_9TELE|nr:hypothetical protein EYF80_013044 [Liparis tanakae]